MPTFIIIEEPADWEERHRLLFERHELFLQKVCMVLGMDFLTTGENDILMILEKHKEILSVGVLP